MVVMESGRVTTATGSSAAVTTTKRGGAKRRKTTVTTNATNHGNKNGKQRATILSPFPYG